MQIDVLSQNTLKLTLSRIDMFDLDIKYESLSGKNPDTKRLLSHVLRTVRVDKNAGVDFTGERLFVEAFPRPDGGCMLYISCLSESGEMSESESDKSQSLNGFDLPEKKQNTVLRKKSVSLNKSKNNKNSTSTLLCCFTSVKALENACRGLFWQSSQNRIELESSLYNGNREYRLFVRTNDGRLTAAIAAEYGEILPREQMPYTFEHYKLLAAQNAVELLGSMGSVGSVGNTPA